MKTQLLLPLVLLTGTSLSPISLRAQTSAESNSGASSVSATPAPTAQPSGQPSAAIDRRGPMGQLSEEEKARVKAAHDKAIQQNPKLEQRMKEARQAMETAKKAMHDAMLAVDPSVEPLLARMMPPPKPPGPAPIPAPAEVAKAPGAFQPAHHLPPPGMANLTEGERERLHALHDQVRNDPSVISAMEALKTASSPEARKAAEEALHDARKGAMLKADPSIEEILKKLHPEAPGVPQASPSPSVPVSR